MLCFTVLCENVYTCYVLGEGVHIRLDGLCLGVHMRFYVRFYVRLYVQGDLQY